MGLRTVFTDRTHISLSASRPRRHRDSEAWEPKTRPKVVSRPRGRRRPVPPQSTIASARQYGDLVTTAVWPGVVYRGRSSESRELPLSQYRGTSGVHGAALAAAEEYGRRNGTASPSSRCAPTAALRDAARRPRELSLFQTNPARPRLIALVRDRARACAREGNPIRRSRALEAPAKGAALWSPN